MNEKYGQLANVERIEKTIALEENGVKVILTENGQAAKDKVLEILPVNAEVMNMSSQTLKEIGVDEIVVNDKKYHSVRNQLPTLDDDAQKMQKQRLGAAQEWAIGSVHAVTEDGQVFVASATGSQLPAYAFGAFNVLWVVGSQKIVKDAVEAKERIYEYCLPLENERALKAYGIGSSVNKIFTLNKEATPDRITMIIAKKN